MSFDTAMQSYMLSPSAEGRAALAREIFATPNYSPNLMLPAASEHAPAQMVEQINALMPGAFLSPRAHAELARAYGALGDEKSAKREQKAARLAVIGLRESGSGTKESPIGVLRVQDEYDLLDIAGTPSRGQRLEQTETAAFDVHELEDGTEMWFELLWQRR